MPSINTRRLRLPLNINSYDNINDVLTNSTPWIWRGTHTRVQVALFEGSTFLDTITGLTSIVMEVHLTRSNTVGALLTKEVLVGAFEACNSADWTAGTAQQASFELTDTDTNFDLSHGQEGKAAFWLVFHAVVTTGAKKITLGGTQLQVFEDNAQTGLPVIGTNAPGFRVPSNLHFQLKNADTGNWHDVFIKGTAAGPIITIGPEET